MAARMGSDARDRNMIEIARRLGEQTGTCRVCERLFRLVVAGLVSAHGSPLCPGSEQPPAGGGHGA